MGGRAVVVLALSLAVATATSFAQQGGDFAAELGWVPIGGAERSEVAGSGAVTAVLEGSRLSITGSFEGLPAKATKATLNEGVAKGARGVLNTPAIAELRVRGATSGTLSADVRLSAEQVEALRAGRLFVQVYSERGVLPDHSTLFGWLLRAEPERGARRD
jgi:CHRD domain